MYESFDHLLIQGNWSSDNLLDNSDFYVALHEIVWEENFNAEVLAVYMRRRLAISPSDYASPNAMAVERFYDMAAAVRDFIKANNLTKP